MKDGRNSNDFHPEVLHGREVAFRVRDEKGQIVVKRSVMESNPALRGSAEFKLKGQEGTFNNNQINSRAGSGFRE